MPFGFSDPLNSSLEDILSASGSRQAAYPVLPEQEAQGAISTLTHNALSGLGYVGSSLDKLFGGRAVRGLIDTLAGSGKHPEEILSAIPFSDALGITNPEQAISGSQLIKNTTGYDPQQGNWAERNLLGPAAEIALDPATWLGGVGALTKAGKAARAEGTLTKGFLPSIRAGERTLAYGLTGDMPASLLEGAGGLVRDANDVLRGIPGIAPVEDVLGSAAKRAQTVGRSLFSAEHGWVADPTIQESFHDVKRPLEKAGRVGIRKDFADLWRQKQDILAQGVDPEQLDRYLRQAVENVPDRFYDPTFLANWPEGARTLAEDLKRKGADLPLQAERAAGYAGPELADEINYSLREKNPVLQEPTQDWMGKAKLMSSTHPSMKGRLEGTSGLAGGTMQLEDLIHTPGFTGEGAPLADVSKEILRQNLGLDIGAQFSPLSETFGSKWTSAGAKQAEENTKFLQSLDPSRLFTETGKPIPFYDPDVLKAMAHRAERANKVTSTAETVYDVLGKAARQGQEGVPASAILSNIGLDTEQGFRIALARVGVDPATIEAAIATSPGKPPEAVLKGLLAGYNVPTETARGLTDLMQRYTAPEELGPVARFFNPALQTTKKALYTIWPSAHARNLISGKYQNLIDVGIMPWDPAYLTGREAMQGKPIVSGIESMAGLAPEQQSQELLKSAYAQGVIGNKMGELAPSAHLDPYAGNPLSPRPSLRDLGSTLKQDLTTGEWRNPLSDEAALVKAGQGMNALVEENLRMGEYTKLLQRGWTPQAAAEQVIKTHFDYQHGLSEFEKKYGRSWLTFPTYSRFNIPKQIGIATTNPGRISAPIRFSGAMDLGTGYVPQYLQGGLATPIPNPENPEGTQTYLSKAGLPFEEAFGHLTTGPSTLSTVQRTGQNFLSMLRPDVKAALEWFSGTQLHTGRKLSDLEPGKLASGFHNLDEDTATFLAQLISGSPLSRVASTANRLMDERKFNAPGVLGNIAALTTGLRTTDVDVEKWRAIDARRQLEDLFQRSPHIKQSVDYFVPLEQKPNLTPEETEQMRIFNTLKANAREAKKQKRLGVNLGAGTLSQPQGLL